MPTNDEIIEKYTELVISKDDGDEVEAIVNWNREVALNEARADTANQIFAELRKIITLFPNNIGEPDIKVIFLESDEYKALKKKYGVD